MATNLDYNVNVNATNGIQSLTNLQNKVTVLNSAFGNLKNAVAGLAVGQAIINILRFADGVSDLSDATGIAVENILGFQNAVKGLGGSAEGADKGILRLVTQIGAAAEGSAELQYAFSRVGVSLNDLKTLSEEEILSKTILGIGTLTSKSDQALLKQQLLGKEFRNVSIAANNLANAYNVASQNALKNAEAIRSAAETYDQFEKAIGAFKLGVLSAIEPTTKFLAALDPSKIGKFAEAMGEVITVLVLVGGYFKIIGMLSVALGELVIVAGGAAATFISWGLTIARFFGWIGLIIGALSTLNSIIKFAFDIDPIKELVDWTEKAFKGIKDFLGIRTVDASNKNTSAAKENAQATAAAGEAARNVIDPFKSLRDQISGLADDYTRVNKATLDNIINSTALIGKSREESEIRKAMADLTKREADEIRKLTDQKGKLTKEQQQAGLAGEIDLQIVKIKEQTQADIEATQIAIRNSESRMNSRKLEEFAINSQITVEKDLQKLQDDIAKSTMSEIQKKQYDILAVAKERATAEIRAEEARRGALLTDQEKLKYYDAAKKGTDELIEKETELYSKSREFSTGWKQAFQEYIDNATNAANIARDVFQKVTRGMEDMIVNFAKTGKFEFKGFMNSILEDLLRSQVRGLLAQTLGAMASSGSNTGGGGVGNLFGGFFATGGVIPPGRFGVVGEAGAELVSGPATVTPLGGAGANVTYNINAVDAMSFKQLLAQDPSFIYALSQQGGKSVPGRR